MMVLYRRGLLVWSFYLLHIYLLSLLTKTFYTFSTDLQTPAAAATSITIGRRQWCKHLISTSIAVGGSGSVCNPKCNDVTTNELRLALRDYTKLAPLGKVEKSSIKTYDLPLQVLAKRLEHDLLFGSKINRPNQGYILTGDISTDLFRDDCIFIDPTNRVSSLSQYQQALRILFDPTTSSISLVEPFTVNEETRTIQGVYRSRGYLQLPWKPYVTAYESYIEYKIDKDGLVQEQVQRWSKSASTALQESFTPSLFTPPPASSILAKSDEPDDVTKLFQILNGRRYDEYTTMEHDEIDILIDKIAQGGYSSRYQTQLPGKWRLVYLQPGPNGAGIDRRIPFFPELPFNDNYQIFTKSDEITNIGEVLGPNVAVRVFGTLEAIASPSSSTTAAPQRFQAHIQGGKLCAGETTCIDLPIAGEGLFDSVYLGDRLRIGQNLNGGGARVVQIRLG